MKTEPIEQIRKKLRNDTAYATERLTVEVVFIASLVLAVTMLVIAGLQTWPQGPSEWTMVCMAGALVAWAIFLRLGGNLLIDIADAQMHVEARARAVAMQTAPVQPSHAPIKRPMVATATLPR